MMLRAASTPSHYISAPAFLTSPYRCQRSTCGGMFFADQTRTPPRDTGRFTRELFAFAGAIDGNARSSYDYFNPPRCIRRGLSRRVQDTMRRHFGRQPRQHIRAGAGLWRCLRQRKMYLGSTPKGWETHEFFRLHADGRFQPSFARIWSSP